MTEYQTHHQIVQYLKIRYPKAIFHSDLSGVWLPSRGTMNKMAALNKYRGYPDCVIFSPNKHYVGFAMEIKKDGCSPFKKDGTLKKDEHLTEQTYWLNIFRNAGFKASFVVGVDEAITLIDKYFNDEI